MEKLNICLSSNKIKKDNRIYFISGILMGLNSNKIRKYFDIYTNKNKYDLPYYLMNSIEFQLLSYNSNINDIKILLDKYKDLFCHKNKNENKRFINICVFIEKYILPLRVDQTSLDIVNAYEEFANFNKWRVIQGLVFGILFFLL